MSYGYGGGAAIVIDVIDVVDVVAAAVKVQSGITVIAACNLYDLTYCILHRRLIMQLIGTSNEGNADGSAQARGTATRCSCALYCQQQQPLLALVVVGLVRLGWQGLVRLGEPESLQGLVRLGVQGKFVLICGDVSS